MSAPFPLPRPDLEALVSAVGAGWDPLRGRKIFLTGGSGFVGRWLVESFLHANQTRRLDSMLTVLSRDPDRVRSALPHLACGGSVEWIQGSMESFPFPTGEHCFVIHAAAPVDESNDPRMLSTLAAGTERVLQFSRLNPVCSFLNVSSGVVAGLEAEGAASMPPTPYGLAKQRQEELCRQRWQTGGLPLRTARLFSLVGPALGERFAIQQFIHQALAGGPIVVRGTGRPLRSYLYAADMTALLWKIVLQGQDGLVYNVGSPEPISIGETARLVASSFEPAPEVQVRGEAEEGLAGMRYFPDETANWPELELKTPLQEGIRKTVAWLRTGTT